MLDTEEVRDLITGKLKHRKCPVCDNNGVVYWDGKTGEGKVLVHQELMQSGCPTVGARIAMD